ncbi:MULTISPECIES: hypothetical protein [Saccharothrix]|uniref:hypothetical protein n=1 Tax=Saccharothrix TaxID=2071 RepID=UPI00093F5426|nr:hypothetical protein [Saccharothrix sp. CB00851]OKI26998.1 hypothetical protein A6A25_07070 [Saccharothrix sp. CB00851]
MVGAVAAGAALDHEQQAQVEVVQRQAVPEGGGEVEDAARLGVPGDEVAARAGVAAERQGDQFGRRVTPERPFVVDEPDDPGWPVTVVGEADEDRPSWTINLWTPRC